MLSLDKFNLIFYDLETTSLDLFEARILEIGACYPDGETYFHEYVKHPWPIKNTHIHGIDHEVLEKKNARYLSEVLDDFEKFIAMKFPNNGNAVYLVAHNNLGYDKWVLEINYKRLNKKIPENWRFMDTLPQLRKLCNFNNYKLGNIYEKMFNETLENAHSALADTKALYKIYNYFVNNIIFKEENKEKIKSLVADGNWQEMDWNMIAISVFTGFISSSHLYTQLSTTDSKALFQKIETLNIQGYCLKKIKENGFYEIKDILIFYLIVYPNFEENLESQMGIKSTYYIKKIKDYMEYYCYILYNFYPKKLIKQEHINEVKKKIKII